MRTPITGKQLAELSADNPRIKYRRAKMLVATARRDPGRLSPHIPFFVKLLQNENNILKWTAIDILGYSAAVMKKDRVERLLGTLAGFLRGGRLIAANHAISAASTIARTKPAFQERILRELLAVEGYSFETDECHNIALGKVLDAIHSSFSGEEWRGETDPFVRRQLGNNRPATRKRAERLMKRR
jgi:hypothetical protein